MSCKTQARLGQEVGVAEKSIARWERGESMPGNMDCLEALANSLGYEVWQLFHPEPEKAKRWQALGKATDHGQDFTPATDFALGKAQVRSFQRNPLALEKYLEEHPDRAEAVSKALKELEDEQARQAEEDEGYGFARNNRKPRTAAHVARESA